MVEETAAGAEWARPTEVPPLRSVGKPEGLPEWDPKRLEGLSPYEAFVVDVNFKMEKKRAQALIDLHESDDVFKSPFEICAKYGYPMELHHIETEDGFILTAFRISGPKGASPTDIYKAGSERPALIYQHGLLDSSDGLLCNGKDSLAFDFADRGYDVWLTNSRGNKYSKSHRYMDEEEEQFWDFSLQEMGEFDVVANVEFVLKLTGQPKLNFMGHSQGTAQMFACLATRPKWCQERINLFMAVAPVARVGNADGRLLKPMASNALLVSMVEQFGPEIMPDANIDSNLAKLFLKLTNVDDVGLGKFSDADASKISDLGKLNYQGHYPAGASFRSIDHFKQLVLNGEFAMYDFGPKENLKRYGQKTAPVYDVGNIKNVPVALFCGTDDLLASEKDYNWLRQQLDANDSLAFFGEYDLGHLGLLMPQDPSHFKDIITVLNKHNGKE